MTGQQRPSSTCLPLPSRPRFLYNNSEDFKRPSARHRLSVYSTKAPPGCCASDVAVFCACTPKQTALDIHLHQHTSGAALLPPSPDTTAPLELDFYLSLQRRRHRTPRRLFPIPHVISPSLSHPIKRVCAS